MTPPTPDISPTPTPGTWHPAMSANHPWEHGEPVRLDTAHEGTIDTTSGSARITFRDVSGDALTPRMALRLGHVIERWEPAPPPPVEPGWYVRESRMGNFNATIYILAHGKGWATGTDGATRPVVGALPEDLVRLRATERRPVLRSRADVDALAGRALILDSNGREFMNYAGGLHDVKGLRTVSSAAVTLPATVEWVAASSA